MTSTLTLRPDRTSELSEVFHLMGDPSRLGILMSVMEEPRAVGDIAAQTGHSLSLVSHHLRLLRARRLVRAERRGKQVYYSLDDAHVRSVLQDMVEHLGEEGR
jgi:DNA-binding transcriptional ArsR family regulator